MPVRASEYTGEAAPVEADRLEYLAAFAHAHTTLVSDVGVPDSTFGIEANPVWMIRAGIGPHAPVRQVARGVDIEGCEPVGVGFRDKSILAA